MRKNNRASTCRRENAEGVRPLIRAWIEAMRMRTLPVSVAGVLCAVGFCMGADCFNLTLSLLCMAVAVLAQIASNFANEYFDFRAGLDRPGRVGPRRGVTEGDITPRAMFVATLITLGLACCAGLALAVITGYWWVIPAGVLIAVGVMAYSAGPWPFSRHCLGEVAVFVYFGLVPVTLTYALQAGSISTPVWLAACAEGLMGANVLLVNNIRDIPDDRAVGKHTLPSAIGARMASGLYFVNSLAAAILLMLALGQYTPVWGLRVLPWIYPLLTVVPCCRLANRTGHTLNPLLGITSMAMLIVTLIVCVVLAIYS